MNDNFRQAYIVQSILLISLIAFLPMTDRMDSFESKARIYALWMILSMMASAIVGSGNNSYHWVWAICPDKIVELLLYLLSAIGYFGVAEPPILRQDKSGKGNAFGLKPLEGT